MNDEDKTRINDHYRMNYELWRMMNDQYTMNVEQWTRIIVQRTMNDEQRTRINDEWTKHLTMNNEQCIMNNEQG